MVSYIMSFPWIPITKTIALDKDTTNMKFGEDTLLEKNQKVYGMFIRQPATNQLTNTGNPTVNLSLLRKMMLKLRIKANQTYFEAFPLENLIRMDASMWFYPLPGISIDMKTSEFYAHNNVGTEWDAAANNNEELEITFLVDNISCEPAPSLDPLLQYQNG